MEKYDDDDTLYSLLNYIAIQISNSTRLSGVSNDPSFYYGKIDALQDLRREIVKIIDDNKNCI